MMLINNHQFEGPAHSRNVASGGWAVVRTYCSLLLVVSSMMAGSPLSANASSLLAHTDTSQAAAWSGSARYVQDEIQAPSRPGSPRPVWHEELEWTLVGSGEQVALVQRWDTFTAARVYALDSNWTASGSSGVEGGPLTPRSASGSGPILVGFDESGEHYRISFPPSTKSGPVWVLGGVQLPALDDQTGTEGGDDVGGDTTALVLAGMRKLSAGFDHLISSEQTLTWDFRSACAADQNPPSDQLGDVGCGIVLSEGSRG